MPQVEASKKPLRGFSWEEMLQRWVPLGKKVAGLGGGLGEPRDTEGRNLWGTEEASIPYLRIHTKPVSLWASGFLAPRRPALPAFHPPTLATPSSPRHTLWPPCAPLAHSAHSRLPRPVFPLRDLSPGP